MNIVWKISKGIEGIGISIKRHLVLYSLLTIAAGIAAGRIWDGELLKYLIPLALFIMLFPAFLDIKIVEAVKNLFADGKLIVMAMLVNFIISPVLMYCLLRIFPAAPVPDLILGLLIFSLIPGGGMGPAYTGMVNGNVGLSVMITSAGLILSIVFMPLWTVLLAGKAVQVPALLIVKYLFMIIIVPALAASGYRRCIIHFKGEPAFKRIHGRLQNTTGIGLILLIFIIFVTNGKIVIKNYCLISNIVFPAFSFSLLLLIVSTLIVMVCRSGYRDGVSFTISVTLKNTAVSMALATTVFHDLTAVAIAIAGPLIQFPVMISYIKFRMAMSSSKL